LVTKLGVSFKTESGANSGDKAASSDNINWAMTELILVIMVIYITMAHGPACDLFGRTLPDQNPVPVDIIALSHRHRLVRRYAAIARDCHPHQENIVWTAALPESPDRYTSLRMSLDGLTAYRFGGFLVKLAIETGRVIDRQFVK
jgi:hypothetical protein